jgi:hypothetical protein
VISLVFWVITRDTRPIRANPDSTGFILVEAVYCISTNGICIRRIVEIFAESMAIKSV